MFQSFQSSKILYKQRLKALFIILLIALLYIQEKTFK